MNDNELEKFIFDPKNPGKCKVYNQLLNLVKSEQTAYCLSPTYFFELFKDQFPIKERLWDIPENFGSLTTLEKFAVYLNQYSSTELYELLNSSKIQEPFEDETLLSKINNTLGMPFTIHTHFAMYSASPEELLKWSIKTIQDNKRADLADSNMLALKYIPNFVIFFDKHMRSLIQQFKPAKSSIAILTLDMYKSLNIDFNSNVRPLLLERVQDIHLLLEMLYQDKQNALGKIGIPEGKQQTTAKIDSIEIKNYFSLKEISLKNLKKKREIYFVGENGDGKTLLLQAIALAMRGEETGLITDFLKETKQDLQLKAVDSEKRAFQFGKETEDSFKNLFAYGVNRHQNDSDKKEIYGYLTLFNSSLHLNNPVKWLQNLDHKESRKEQDHIPLELAKKMIRDLLDENIEIEITPDEVFFHERETKTDFDRLSEGYRSVMIWVCDLVIRLSQNQPEVRQLRDFNGVVLVDEIDLHLHPKWKFRVIGKLREWFPNIQFFFTTHSPTVILGSSDDAVFYRLYKEKGVTKISQPLKSIRNLMANSVLTSPLFSLEQARAKNSDPEAVDTSDDFLYTIIHKEIANRVSEEFGITDDEILQMVRDELDQFEQKEKEQGNDQD